LFHQHLFGDVRFIVQHKGAGIGHGKSVVFWIQLQFTI
jgi:hypothetical protein